MDRPEPQNEFLARDPRVRAGDVAWRHVRSEFADVVDDIIATLAPEEPYAYTVNPLPTADGSIPLQRIETTRAALRAVYEDLHRVTLVRDIIPVTEIRGDWYVFLYGLGEGLIKQTGQVVHSPTAVLFPTMGQSGITGELFWMRSSTGAPFTDGRQGPLAAEAAVLGRHDAWLEGARNGDVDAMVGLCHPQTQTAVRDYVNDTGTLTELHTAGALKAHLQAFFERYRVLELDIIQRFACDWFVFAELLWVVEDKTTPGRRQTFYTADHAEVWPDGRFAVRIGHGTEPEPV